MNDWNRVTSLQPKRLVIVKRFKTSGKKVKGLLLRADVRSVRVETKDGDIEIPRDTVRALSVRRRGWKKAPWIGAAIGFGVVAALTTREADFVQPAGALLFGGAGAGLGALAGLGARILGQNKLVYRVENRN